MPVMLVISCTDLHVRCRLPLVFTNGITRGLKLWVEQNVHKI